MTIRELAESLRENSKELADYISSNFEFSVADHQFTGHEAIEAMREGTPARIYYYTIAGI